MAEWREVKLGDVVEIRRGASPRPIHHFLSKAGIPWVKIADATSDDSRYITHTNEYIKEEGVAHSVTVEPETLIVSNSATPGLPKIMQIRACVHDGWLVFSNYKGIIRDFLYYKFKEIQRSLVNQANGSVFQNLKTDIVREFPISLPPVEMQRKIAGVLGALDDKIELNNKINQNLELQAQALFKSWFVDFEPFGGTKPSDWKEIQLTEIADFIGGYSYKGAELKQSTTAMATIKNFDRNGGFKLDGYKEIEPSSKLKQNQYVELFDTLVAHTDLTQNAEVIGNAEMLLSKGKYKNVIISMDVVRVVPKNGISKYLLAAILKDPHFKKHCLGYVNGTTVLHLSKRALPEYSLIFPKNVKILDNISGLFEDLYKKIALNIEENIRLSILRDTLLPKLMSGEINVDNVDIFTFERMQIDNDI